MSFYLFGYSLQMELVAAPVASSLSYILHSSKKPLLHTKFNNYAMLYTIELKYALIIMQ